MKRIITTLLAASLMLLGTEAFAQVSVNAGYLNSTLAYENASDNDNGLFAGVTATIPIIGGLSIAPGVYYSMLTGKVLDFGTIANAILTEHAVNVPVYVSYGYDLSRDMKVFFFGGPTLQYGLASNTKYSSGLISDSSLTVDNYKDSSNYERKNVFLGGGLGMQVAGFLVSLGYDYGLMNQFKSDNSVAHRSNLKIGVGYAF